MKLLGNSAGFSGECIWQMLKVRKHQEPKATFDAGPQGADSRVQGKSEVVKGGLFISGILLDTFAGLGFLSIQLASVEQ